MTEEKKKEKYNWVERWKKCVFYGRHKMGLLKISYELCVFAASHADIKIVGKMYFLFVHVSFCVIFSYVAPDSSSVTCGCLSNIEKHSPQPCFTAAWDWAVRLVVTSFLTHMLNINIWLLSRQRQKPLLQSNALFRRFSVSAFSIT